MRYYGAKTKLLPFIEGVVKITGVNGTSNFVDLFSGTSVVGRHFKKLGFTVIANDTLEFSYAIAKTYIELNKEPQFKRLSSHLKFKNGVKGLFDYLNNLKTQKAGFMYENYSPTGGRKYFTDQNALRIDTFRYLFEEWKDEKRISVSEYYYLITSLLRGVNLVSNVSGTYAAYLKTWDKRALNSLRLEPVDIIPSENKNKAFKQDANELVKEIQPDILYLDPPYNGRQYASNYFILELIAEGWFKNMPEIYGETGMRKYDHQKSKYCSKVSALGALEDLISCSSKSQYIVLSYNNEGVIPQSAIYQTLSRIGRVETFTENHKRYKSINQTAEDPQLTREHLFLVKPTKAVNQTNSLTGKEWLRNSFSIWRDLGKSDEEKQLHHPAIFTIRLISKLIETFCKPNGGRILDCFAGSGTTLIAGLKNDKDVIGIDLNPDYKELFVKRAASSYNIVPHGLEDKYIVGDSRHLSQKLELESVDLCITSPPYWDILNRQRTADYKENENYSNKDNDLGNITGYDEFISTLKEVCNEVFKVMKPKGYFIMNVMDLRKKDKFFPLHIDAARIVQEVGFSFEDIIIWDRQQEYNNMRPLGYPYKFIVNKVHEYVLIFRKPVNG
ncbi:MAG: DNA adenine methylase [Chloracidobacterium sp.]|nr:DNA adenine methylase [Chloracidobacterium sp.]MCO5334682.1 DNA adenine methylase [Pyrinomonadaceae bacterium]